jgi:hypothetical protein
VKGDVLVDHLDDSFCRSYNALPAKCFVVKKRTMLFSSGLLGFKNEENALSYWLEENVLNRFPAVRQVLVSHRIKTVLVGDKSYGKTCLYNRFAKGSFPTVYIPSVSEHYVADLEVDGEDFEIALWDTCGGEEYERLRQMYSSSCLLWDHQSLWITALACGPLS